MRGCHPPALALLCSLLVAAGLTAQETPPGGSSAGLDTAAIERLTGINRPDAG